MDDLKASVIQLCSRIGRDPLLVQGAGGNLSWKDGNVLWVKASGTWLSDAGDENIFVSVDLTELQSSLGRGDFSIAPKLTGSLDLKPSIETLLHGLMPQKVVAHVHAVEALAHLVRSDCESTLAALLGNTVAWETVDYFKPGADLASAVSRALVMNPKINVLFLKSHGVVIGGETCDDIQQVLNFLTSALRLEARRSVPAGSLVPFIDTYSALADEAIHSLACDDDLHGRLETDWALYPDHVVFLGPIAYTFNAWSDLSSVIAEGGDLPELVFIRGEGVFALPGFSEAKIAQLRCYYDVLVRQPKDMKLHSLSADQVAELLNWDAEKYRMCITRK